MFKINILPVFVKYSTLKIGNTSFASSWPRPLQFYQQMLENVADNGNNGASVAWPAGCMYIHISSIGNNGAAVAWRAGCKVVYRKMEKSEGKT
jgi:hypothetical protein